ncbi:MAG TPA: hypothetical protein DDY68_05950, partial [Porphyromonadaceae bacterium]|nr:hypothetical protein [Porphyromonadaceae bacterium]
MENKVNNEFLNQKSILITVAYLDGFHGSVIHVKEWGTYFVSKGFNVTIATIMWTPEIYNMITRYGVKVRSVFEDWNEKFDIVIAYHFPTIGLLLKKGVDCTKMVLGSLSSFEYLESFPLFFELASCLVCVSEESKLFHHLSGIPLEQMIVIENSIPDEYFNFTIKKKHELPEKIAIVSNHIPEELRDIKRERKFDTIDFIGMGGDIYTEITPALLSGYDVVISIGKTVQYAMGLGIPVFEYDYFGGCGYLSLENFYREKETNYSGRTTRRKISTYEIVTEILNGYANALHETDKIRQIAKDIFSLSKKLDFLLLKLHNTKDFSKNDLLNLNSNVTIEFDHNECFCKWTGHLKQENFSLKRNYPLYYNRFSCIEVFYDTGKGFSEGEKDVFSEFPITIYSRDNLRALRVDPSCNYCSVRIRSIKAEGEEIPFSTNANFIDREEYFFNTNDPQIYIDVRPNAEKYEFDMEVLQLNAEFAGKLSHTQCTLKETQRELSG